MKTANSSENRIPKQEFDPKNPIDDDGEKIPDFDPEDLEVMEESSPDED